MRTYKPQLTLIQPQGTTNYTKCVRLTHCISEQASPSSATPEPSPPTAILGDWATVPAALTSILLLPPPTMAR